MPIYVSFTLKDSKHVSDGTSIEHATQEISKYKQVFAIGINCVSPKLVDQALKEFAKYTSKPLVVYPNLGATYDPKIKKWRSFKEKFDFAELTQKWYEDGARLMGDAVQLG